MFTPNAEIVTVYWLKGVDTLPTNNIATTLPDKSKSFADNGFIIVTALGGTFDNELKVYQSRLDVRCYAYNENSQHLPYGKASTLASNIFEATASEGRRVVLPEKFNDARVYSVMPIFGPQRVLDEGFAVYRINLEIYWTEINK